MYEETRIEGGTVCGLNVVADTEKAVETETKAEPTKEVPTEPKPAAKTAKKAVKKK